MSLKHKIAALADQGDHPPRIARELGISSRLAREHVRRGGLPRNYGKLFRYRTNYPIRCALALGYTYEEVSQLYGFGVTHLRRLTSHVRYVPPCMR